MPQTYYFGKKPVEERKLLRRILLVTGIAALLVTVGILVYFHQYNTRMSNTLASFQHSLEENEFPEALAMYRNIHEVAMDQGDRDSQEKDILLEMERIVKEETEALMSRIRTERYVPNATERSFLEQMGEVTGVVISTWLVDLSNEFLFRQIERPTLQFILDQLSGFSNVASASASLQKSMNSIEKASGQVQSAEKLLQEKSYIESINAYEAMYDEFVNEDDFVAFFCLDRIEYGKQLMYEPMILMAKEMIADFKYYSAESILSEMVQFFPGDATIQQLLLETTANTSLVLPYRGKVEVLCVRPLLADTNLAFSKNNYTITENSYLSTKEFSRILEALYEDGFILIDVRIMTDQTNPTQLVREELRLPEGKKPLIIVVENLNYSPRSSGLGFCRRLVLDDQNQVCGEYITADGETVVDRMAESIGILDAFVEEHPDFSFDGAKGIVSFSGFEVVMGYVTNEDQIDDYNEKAEVAGALPIMPTRSELEANAQTVTEIMRVMKESGWVLGSSSYTSLSMNSMSMDEINADTEKWLDQIGALTGETPVLVYPNGSFINGSDPRCVYLKDMGFRIFFGISPTPYFTYGENYLYLDRTILNGQNLREVNLSRLFAVSEIYDEDRRTPLR